MNETLTTYLARFDAERWGLPTGAVAQLGTRLHAFWQRYAPCFRTATRDGSPYAYAYLSGQLRMPTDRHFAGIARTMTLAPQNLQHFMSNSPWSASAVLAQVQAELCATPDLADGTLILDESAEKKAGDHAVGAARQWNGRLGKVDLSQVGTFLAYRCGDIWTWIDGELFLPAGWLAPAHAALNHLLGIPPDRQFATKIELGWQMIQRVAARGLRFRLVACDDLYGRADWFRAALHAAQMRYMADVPHSTQVYLSAPTLGVPPPHAGQRGPRARTPQVLAGTPLTVGQVARRPDTVFTVVRVRPSEHGEVRAAFAARRVWTGRDGLPTAQEWLVIRREGPDSYTFSLSNAPPTSTLSELAADKCERYWVERANQDAKSELGWDELQAQKWRAWEHHLALTVLASWFIAQTKHEWAAAHPRSRELAGEWGLTELPRLSVANVRELLRAVLPLPQLTPAEATARVIEHLVNRTRSRKSRLKRQLGPLS